MSEEILKALTQLFAIISKQDGGVTEQERDFVISFYEQDLDTDTVKEYVALYDKYSEYAKEPEVAEAKKELDENGVPKKKKKKRRVTKVNEAVRVLALCRKINRTLTQKQKVIVLFKILEMLAADRNFTEQRIEIISTVGQVFNIPKVEYKLIESFVIEEHSSAATLDSEDILIFDDEIPAEDSAIKFIDSGLLDGEIIFIRVKSVGLYFTKYTGEDDIYLNNLPVKRDSILLFSHGSVFKTPKGAPLYYSDLVSNYNSDVDTTNISFNVFDLGFQFPNGAVGLRNVNLSEGGGRLIGIMGASGAGKTTLLNTLAGLATPTKGQVLINGYDIHDQNDALNIEGVIGYIAQDDLLIEELTVRQNLYYNAKLCFKNLTDREIMQKVEDVLASLGLDRIMDLRVGSVLDKTISGGQRKRLNIALELIREPAVLFVDEPTSGLSSKDSENVIDLLKELSLKNKLIFVVIHQPSSDIYKMFDKMWIMDTGGYPVFYGDPIEAVTYFKRAARQVGSDQGQCNTCGNVNPEQLFTILEAQVVDEYGEFTGKRKIKPEEWHSMYLQDFEVKHMEDVKEEPPKNLKIPSRFTQAAIFTIRDVLSKLSNTQYMAINLLEAPLLALLMALVIRYKYTLDSQDAMFKEFLYVFRHNENIPAYILICIIIALFMGLTVSAEEIIKDRKIKRRESFLNLSNLSYLASKLLILFTLSSIQTLSFVLLGNFILGINDMNITYWLVLFSVSCYANVLGLNISSAFDSAVTVYILIPLLLIPQMILSGAIFPFAKLNNSISEQGKVPIVADMWISRWAYEAIVVDQFKSNPYRKLIFDYEQNQSNADFRATFWVDEIKSVIDQAIAHKKAIKDSDQAAKDSILLLLERKIRLVKDELAEIEIPVRKELDKLPLQELLTSEAFNEEVAEQLKKVVEGIRLHYSGKYTEAMNSKDSLLAIYEPASITEMLNMYSNESLKDVVRNANSTDKVGIEGTKIIQFTDPIYAKPRPSSLLDYRTHFYASQKHFLGSYFDTYYFNIFVIWFFTAIFCVTLYFDVLRKLINVATNIKIPSFGRKK